MPQQLCKREWPLRRGSGRYGTRSLPRRQALQVEDTDVTVESVYQRAFLSLNAVHDLKSAGTPAISSLKSRVVQGGEDR